jgi:hypothetical protein
MNMNNKSESIQKEEVVNGVTEESHDQHLTEQDEQVSELRYESETSRLRNAVFTFMARCLTYTHHHSSLLFVVQADELNVLLQAPTPSIPCSLCSELTL